MARQVCVDVFSRSLILHTVTSAPALEPAWGHILFSKPTQRLLAASSDLQGADVSQISARSIIMTSGSRGDSTNP